MIQVENVVKQYGKKTVLDHISFEVGKGEVLGLLGKNGAGKSTTMNIITGNLTATEGTARIDGYDIMENPLEAKKNLGFLPELPPLYPEMTVKNYLQFVYRLKKAEQPRDQHIKEICEQTGIQEVSDRVIRHLSKGYCQRLGIAQALIGNPEVLILDEPMVGLDPKQIVEIRGLIGQLKKTHTMILSSHILTEVQSVCDRIVVLSEGKIVANDTPVTLLKNSSGGQLKVRIEGKEEWLLPFLSQIPGIRQVRSLGIKENGSVDFLIDTEGDIDVRREIFRRLASRKCPLLYMAPLETNLEQVFLHLTDED